MNQDAVDPVAVAGTPLVQAVANPSMTPHAGPVDAPLPSSNTTPSSTPLPLELHIDEDGSAPTSSPRSTVIMASSKSFQYSEIRQKDNGGCVTSEVSHVESFSVSSTVKPQSQSEVSPTHPTVTKVSTSKVSKSSVGRCCSPGPLSSVVSRSPVIVSRNPSPLIGDKSPSPPDLIAESPAPKTASPVVTSPDSQAVIKSNSPVAVLTTTEAVPKSTSPVTVPRLSSPVPKSSSPVTVPCISSPVPIPKGASPEISPKSASPVTIPRLSSPVPKIASPITVPNISISPAALKSSSPETVPKNTCPVTRPTLSSPVTVPKSPAPVIKKTYIVQSTSSPRASPVSPAIPPTESQRGNVLDLTWPCREPLLDDALDKLLASESTRPGETQPPVFVTPGDEDRSWEEEDGIYPDLSREETLTPMTESSWMDECFTPSSCPGTPDGTLDLPMQQPSAVERLSASGQVGR